MSSDISMQTTTYQVADRRWLLAEPDVKFGETLDISKFTSGTHYPNGYIPSGTVVGRVTATKLLGPYDDTASDGRQTAVGHMYDDARAVRQNGTTATQVPVAVATYDCVVSIAKLPFASGAGAIDANGQADLRNINYRP